MQNTIKQEQNQACPSPTEGERFAPKQKNTIEREQNPNLSEGLPGGSLLHIAKVEIDPGSGFCFGVAKAIKKAEDSLQDGIELYCLEDIVHNTMEIRRLESKGLKTIDHEKFFTMKNCRVLLRAHGEPPSTYEYARANNIELIDATCPVVLNLQKQVKKAYIEMQANGGQVIIFGKKGHAEVTGLNGQANDEAMIIESMEDLELINIQKPSVFFSQTTKSPDDFNLLAGAHKTRSRAKADVKDTICRQVSNRAPQLKNFVAGFDVIIFTGGEKSSNARYLFDICKQVNSRSYFVSNPAELDKAWFTGATSAGVCGATSTPRWLMEEVAGLIRSF